MNDEVFPWIEKAEGDYQGARDLSKKRARKYIHLICFACQQSAEKYLKAFLVEKKIKFPKSHDLTFVLLPLCEKTDLEFKVLQPFLEILDPYAVEFRYPGEELHLSDVRLAIDASTKVRRFVRGKLGLEKQQRLL